MNGLVMETLQIASSHNYKVLHSITVSFTEIFFTNISYVLYVYVTIILPKFFHVLCITDNSETNEKVCENVKIIE